MPFDRNNPRTPSADVDSMFVDRWSPRAFDSTELNQMQIDTLLEAARWSPSCFNEQPWLFVYATEKIDRGRFLEALAEANQVWAQKAPMLVFLLCRRKFKHNGKDNRHAPFDAGAAWMSFALQARKIGLYAHAMAGFSQKKVYEITGVSEKEYDAMAAIAVGYRTSPETLPEKLAVTEAPNNRISVGEFAKKGRI